MQAYSPRHSPEVSFSYFFLYCMSLTIIAILVFLHGFFPLKTNPQETASFSDLPTNVFNTSFSVPQLYKRHVGRLVFMLIDAFRWDFLQGRMPYTNSLIRKSQACFLTARCHPPTATMPKVKALMTGSVPNYIDIALNLGNQVVKEDNLVQQGVKNGLKLLFYGDETWLKLFPGMFLRSEGTTSFFVSDFKEVDFNVSRHITSELKSKDWDIMFLHYLGLDHIGHMSGPTSHHISPKLLEMDDVVKTLHKSMEAWDSLHPGHHSLIVVVGDHGMHDLGSHGGATLGEVLVSLVFIGKDYACVESSGQEVSQVDVTATLAILLGLPIPNSNVGISISQALGRLSDEQHLYALHYNAHQIAQQFINLNPDGVSDGSYQLFLQAEKEHVIWLSSDRTKLSLNNAKIHYRLAMEKMRVYLVNALVEFDFIGMGVGCFLLAQVFLLIIVHVRDAISRNLKAPQLFFLALSGLSNVTVLSKLCQFDGSYNSVLCSCRGSLFIVPVFLIISISFNCWTFFIFVYNGNFQLQKHVNCCTTSGFLLFGSLVHVISFFSSSFVEEEHQTWYFFWVTFLLLLIRRTWKSNQKNSDSDVLPMVFLLLGHRVLRKLNQTGDKWASLPDIGDWVNMPEHINFLWGLAVISILFIWYSALKLKCIFKTVDKLLFGVALMCTLIYRCSNTDIWFCAESGSLAVSSFWILWSVILLRSSLELTNQASPVKILKACIVLWLLLSALLMRPHNLPLLPSLIYASVTLHKLLQNIADITIAHAWLGLIWFFYQGNSNSLATIDVAAGYVGVNQQQMVLSGILIAIHTLNAPVLAILLLWYGLALQDRHLDWNFFRISLHILFLLKLFAISVYCGIVILLRHHLFVWTVFAPKLLYETVLFLCMFFLVLCGYLCSGIFDSKNDLLKPFLTTHFQGNVIT